MTEQITPFEFVDVKQGKFVSFIHLAATFCHLVVFTACGQNLEKSKK